MDNRNYEIKGYDSMQFAEQAANRLERLGYGVRDVSVITGNRADPPKDKEFGEGGVGIGVAAGGLLGLILGGVATAGLGFPLILGPLALAAAGAGMGGVAGGLMELGLNADDVNETLRKGGAVLVVHLKQETDRDAVRKALDVPVTAPPA